jgi:hypothetical protein
LADQVGDLVSARVWVAQCLCPDRHCILAATGVADSAEAASADIAWPLREAVEKALQAALLNPWCGLCHAPPHEWRYEVGRTRFSTLEEAAPLLQRLEAEQAATRAAFGDLPRSD